VRIVITLPQGLQLGDVVAGKYRIDRVLGSGAMGVVVAAHHLNLDRTVAIKFLLGEALHHADSIARFVREARAAARIGSTHVVRVHDVAVLPNGVPYIELEYLEGCDLAARLRQCGRLPVRVAVDFILQACDAIANAHELGIIHRDLKPANLFAVPGFDDTETIKVLDFGISKAAASVWSTVCPVDWQPGAVSTERGPIGSPCYMSPEQMQSARDVDLRTDIWSLGVTLCELATGQLPFQGQSLVELYATIKSQEPLRLRRRCPDLPEGLETVLLRCLEFDRTLRFGSVNALATELLRFGSNRAASYVQRIAASSAGRSSAPPAPAAASGEPVSRPPEPLSSTRVSPTPQPAAVGAASSSRRRLALVVGSLVAFAVLGLAAKEALKAAEPRDERTTGRAAPVAAATAGVEPDPVAAQALAAGPTRVDPSAAVESPASAENTPRIEDSTRPTAPAGSAAGVTSPRATQGSPQSARAALEAVRATLPSTSSPADRERAGAVSKQRDSAPAAASPGAILPPAAMPLPGASTTPGAGSSRAGSASGPVPAPLEAPVASPAPLPGSPAVAGSSAPRPDSATKAPNLDEMLRNRE
jgi:eukaryotic-like serine/threonine-protein kinase